MKKIANEKLNQDQSKKIDQSKVDDIAASLDAKGDQKSVNWTREFTASGSGKGNGGNDGNVGT